MSLQRRRGCGREFKHPAARPKRAEFGRLVSTRFRIPVFWFRAFLGEKQAASALDQRKRVSLEKKERTRMGVAKSLWASVQGDPVFMRRVNGWLTMFWLVMIPVSYEVGWLKSVVYVSALSLWALVSGHWSAWQAARVEVEQQRQVEKEKREPLEEKVVEKIVEKTEIQSEKPSSP
jgi:hypothetical protein